MPQNPVMFNTIVTSDLGEKIASKYGVETEKTLTGFKFIGEKVAKYEKTQAKNYVFGYEESYGSLTVSYTHLARSRGHVNVQVIMERMHGGGHLSAAALQRENTSVEDLRTELIATLDEVMKEE